MISGTSVNIGGTDYVVPSLNLRTYFDQQDAFKIATDPKDYSQNEVIEASLTLLVPTIQRNYPAFTREMLLDVGMIELPSVVAAMFKNAGFIAVPLEQPDVSNQGQLAPKLLDGSSPIPDGSPQTSSTG